MQNDLCTAYCAIRVPHRTVMRRISIAGPAFVYIPSWGRLVIACSLPLGMSAAVLGTVGNARRLLRS